MMLKIIIDTNVLVSSLIQKSYPFNIVSAIFTDENIKPCLSDNLFDEYSNVLNRKKFSSYKDFISNSEILINEIKVKSIWYTPTVEVNLISDFADNKLLELAETCSADFIITGNTKDFTMSYYKGTKIISPKDFWEFYLSL